MQNNNPSQQEVIKRSIAALFIIAIIGVFIYVNNNDTTKIPSKSDTYISCYTYSQDLVKKKLKSPKSADFPWYSDNFIKEKGDTITVTAYVDADNSFGASVRTNYIATIKVKNGEPVSGSVTLLE